MSFRLHTNNMKTFLLLPLLLQVYGNPAGDGHDTGCIDISVWGPVLWSTENLEFCSYTCNKACETKSKSVCVAVPLTTCKLVDYTDCTNTPTSQTARKDSIKPDSFAVKECVDGPIKFIVEIKEMPICRNVTKEKCDSKWVIDETTGQKVWAGNVNCKDVVWQDCHLEEVEMTEAVPTYDCRDGQPLEYDQLLENSVEVTSYSTKCEPKVVPVCQSSTRHECKTVTWEECTDSIEPACLSIPFKTPSQKADHTLRCPLHHQ